MASEISEICCYNHNVPQVFRVLKPGAFFVDSAWALTDLYDPNNPEHVKIKSDIEVSILL